MRRSPAHCIEYAKIIQWPKERPDDSFDAGGTSCLTVWLHACLPYAATAAPLTVGGHCSLCSITSPPSPADCEEHMKWIYDKALARAAEFGIQVGHCCRHRVACAHAHMLLPA